MLLRVVDQAGEAIAQHKFFPVGIGLSEKWKQGVSHPWGHVLFSQYFESVRQI